MGHVYANESAYLEDRDVGDLRHPIPPTESNVDSSRRRQFEGKAHSTLLPAQGLIRCQVRDRDTYLLLPSLPILVHLVSSGSSWFALVVDVVVGAVVVVVV